jgi:hypothetical protein
VIITEFVKRWAIEVTFREAREHLGIETQRQWSNKAIARELLLYYFLQVVQKEDLIEMFAREGFVEEIVNDLSEAV